MRYIKFGIAVLLVTVWAISANALEVDTDANSAVDLAYGGTNATSAAAARVTLGVEIGADVQAYSSVLDTYTGIDPSANIQSTLAAATYAAARALWDLEAGTDFYSISAADSAISAALAAFVGQTNLVTVGTIGTGAWEGTAIDGAYIDIAGTTLETTIAADDEVIIYDTSAGANRSMTRGNFVTGIGAGQAVVFDIGDDGGNDSTDLGEIATTGDTNSIITLDSADKMLIDVSQNWPTADAATNANTVTTITGLAPDTATTQAAQPNITSVGTLTDLTVTGVVTSGGLTVGAAALLEAELEILDGATTTTTALNYVDLTSSAQTQLDAKAGIADADDISGVWTWVDDTAIEIGGTGAGTADWTLTYNETTSNRLELAHAAGADADFYVDLNDNAADASFIITNTDGTYAANLSVDGDGAFGGDLTAASFVATRTTNPQEIQIYEGNATGDDYRGWTVPSILTQTLVYELPNGDPTANDVFLIGAAAVGESALSYGTFSTDNFDITAGTITIKDDGVSMDELNVTGTPDGTKYLRDDGSWQAGTGTPADGETADIQFNAADAFSSDTSFTYATATNTLNITQNGTDPTITTGDGTYTPGRTPQLYVEGVSEFDGILYADAGTRVSALSAPVSSDGAALGSTSLEWADLFLADGAVIQLGADQDVTITHVADTGVLVALDDSIAFGDAAVYIESDDDGYLDLQADTGFRLRVDSAAYLNIATTDGAGTVISQASDGVDTIDLGDATDQVRLLGATAGANDGFYDGIIRTYTVDTGASTSFGQTMHIDTDGELIVADADVASAAAMPAVGLVVETGTGSKKVLVQGQICETDWAWTVGGIVYVSDDPTTTEGLTQTAPATTGDQVQVAGIASTADCVEVNMGGYILVEVP